MRSPKLGLVAAIALPLLFAPAAYVQAQAIKTETVNFDAGTSGTVLKNTLKGEQIVDYKLGASAGQLLSVELTTNNASNYFNIVGPGADAALFIGSTEGTRYSGTLPSSGEYTLRVYLMRNAARRNEAATYDLAISVTDGSGQAANTAQPADFADGLSGGPDMWEVSGLSAGDTLNLRAGTGTGFDVLAKLAAGAVLENLGCQMQDDMRWCQVKRPSDGVSGWVAGQYLREAIGTAATRPPAPAQPQANGMTGNGEPFTATGQIPCSQGQGQPTHNCDFGVVRTDVAGNVSLWIAAGGTEERFIMFENGAPVFTNAADTPMLEKASDLNVISIGSERYEIPDAVLYGG